MKILMLKIYLALFPDQRRMKDLVSAEKSSEAENHLPIVVFLERHALLITRSEHVWYQLKALAMPGLNTEMNNECKNYT